MPRPWRRFELFDQRCSAPFLRARYGHYDPGYRVNRHGHGFVQVLYVGAGAVRVDTDHEVLLQPGAIMVLVPGDGHALAMDDAHGAEIFDCCLAADSALGDWFVTTGSGRVHERRPLAPLVEAIRAEGAHDELHGEWALAGLLLQFATACARALRDHRRAGDTGPDAAATIAALERVIEDRYPEALGLDALAAAVHYSPKHLCRLVKRERGTTPMTMLRAARLRHAQERLLGSDESVATIAQACGFPDPQHFARRFKAELGVTPSQFRADALDD